MKGFFIMSHSYTIFVEYKVQEESLLKYEKEFVPVIRDHVKQITDCTSHEFLLAQAQYGQVVEVIKVSTQDQIDQIRFLRLDSDHPWFQFLDSHIVGGRSKIKLWSFSKLDSE